MKRHGINYPVANDVNGRTQNAYGVAAYPTVFVLDRRGKVRYVDPDDLEASVARLLKET